MIEESEVAKAERKLKELDKELENYQNKGAVSVLGKNRISSTEANNVDQMKKKKMSETVDETGEQCTKKADTVTEKDISGDYVSLS
jgi:hypothetical protein